MTDLSKKSKKGKEMTNFLNRKILIFSPYSKWLVHSQIDVGLGKALELRNCEVMGVLCDGVYSDCVILRGLDTYKAVVNCKFCSSFGSSLFKRFELPSVQLSHYFSNKDYEEAENWVDNLSPNNYISAVYQDLPIGQWVSSSIYTYFRVTSKGLNKPEIQKVYRNYLIDNLVTYKAFSKLIIDFIPDFLILFNGRFAPYRTVFEAARYHNVDVLTHERWLIDNSFSFRNNAICLDKKPVLSHVDSWKNKPLNYSELQTVRQYFSNLENNINTNREAFYTYKTSEYQVRMKLRIPVNAKIFAVFTSSEDERAMTDDHSGFIDQLDIIKAIINCFKDRDEYLVIRHHPHMGGTKHNIPAMDFIARVYQQSVDIHDNVRIIMPSETLTSYSLLCHSDASISFFSTISIEALARGISTASFETSPYSRALPFTLTQDIYKSGHLDPFINELLSHSINLDDLRSLYRFTYSYFFRFSQKFKNFGIKDKYQANILLKSFDELKPGIDPTLDRICNHILQGTPLYEMPPETSDYPSEDDENRFLTQELSRIAERRASLKTQTPVLEEPPVGIIHLQPAQTNSSEFKSPAWQQVSRHRQLNSYPVAVTGSLAEQRTAILALVGTIPEDYILIAHPGIQYNEAFISSAVDQLTEENPENWQGILSGGWIQSPTGAIHHQVFTKSSLALTDGQVLNRLPELRYPLVLLSFLLMKRNALLQLLESLDIEHPSVSEQVLKALETLNIHKTGVPLLLVHQAEVRNAIENVEPTCSHTGHDILTACYDGIKRNPNAVELYRQVAEEFTRRGNLEAARHAYHYVEKLS